MSRVRGVWWAAGSVVAVGLVLGGCTGGGPEPVTTTSEPVVDSPEPSPTPTRDLTKLPERPAAMDEPTTDGAAAAAAYVLDLYVYTINSGDEGPWRAMSLDSCAFCTEVADDAASMRERGETYRGGAIEVLETDVREISAGQWYGVTVKASQQSSQRLDAGGEVLGEDEPTMYEVVFALSWADGWRVDSMGATWDESASPSEEATP